MPDPTTAREAVRDGIASALASVHLGHPDTGPCMQCTIRLNEVMPAVEAAIDEARGQVVEVEMGAHGDCARCGTGTTDSHGDHVSEDLLTHITDWRHRAEHAEASLEQLRRALDAAERAGVAAVDLNQMLRTELRVTANRLAHIPVPETAADARRQVRLAAEYLRTLAGLSAAAKARQAEMEDPPANEDQDDGVARCRVCGCTEDAACPGGCHWVPDPEGDMCNRCFGAAVRVTVEDLATGEREIRAVPAGDYAIFTTDPCSYVVQPLEGGDHRVTVTGRVERTAPS